MITSSAEYERFLANIEVPPSVKLKIRVPTNEPIYQIDWNTRKVSAPPFIGVEGDHAAEYVFFEMDRYYDMIDLADTIGMIIFRNANNDEYYQIIPYYDTDSKLGKIIFPWVIEAPAVMYNGVTTFSMKFFKIDPTSHKLVYEINTTLGKTKVLVGWTSTNKSYTYSLLTPESINSIIVQNDMINVLNDIVAAAQYTQIYWTDVNSNDIVVDPNESYDDGLGLITNG